MVADRRQGAPDRRALGDGAARHRDHQLRQPEVDPAARRRRRGVARGSRASRASSTRRWCRTSRGWTRRSPPGMKEVAVFMSASETHNKKNVNKTIAADAGGVRGEVPPALAAGVRVRAYVSTVYGCPYEGAVDPAKGASSCARALRALGCYQVSLGDTIGVATPRQVRDVLARVLAEIPDRPRSRCTSTTRAARRWPTSSWRSRWASPPSTRRWVGSAAARTRRARPATSRPRTSSTCWRAWASHRHRSRQAGRLRAARLDAGRARDAVEVLPRRDRRPLARARAVERNRG